MEETPASLTMEEINLINYLESISPKIPNIILKVQVYIVKKFQGAIRNYYFEVSIVLLLIEFKLI